MSDSLDSFQPPAVGWQRAFIAWFCLIFFVILLPWFIIMVHEKEKEEACKSAPPSEWVARGCVKAPGTTVEPLGFGGSLPYALCFDPQGHARLCPDLTGATPQVVAK